MCSRPSPSLCVGRRCPGRSCPNADSNALLRTLRVCDRRSGHLTPDDATSGDASALRSSHLRSTTSSHDSSLRSPREFQKSSGQAFTERVEPLQRCALHFLQSVNVVRRLRESLFGEVLELAGEVAGRRRTHRELFVLVPDFREGAERLVPSGQDSVLGLEKVIAGDLAGLLFGLSELL